jgi:hypothetical protein
MAMRISGWGSGEAAGSAIGWGAAAETAEEAEAFGAAGVVAEKQSASANAVTASRINFLCSLFAP